jgi:hypothetical protein
VPDTQRVQDNQRIEREDYEYSVDAVPQAVGRAASGQLLTNPAGARLWVQSGFGLTNPALKQLRVTRGVALLAQREKGQVYSGVLSFEGDLQRTVDLASYAANTYGVFVRFELIDSNFQNRVFWNPTTLAEFTQSVATRRAANWGVRVELISPGAEWFRLGDVAVSASPTLTVVNKRKLYYEGDEANGYASVVSDGFSGAGLVDPTAYRVWGATDVRGLLDRNADRATYGVRDAQSFGAAVREQLRAMQGSSPATPWYGAVAEGLNRKVSRFGDLTLTGAYKVTGSLEVDGGTAVFEQVNPDVTNRALGTTLLRWDAFTRNADVSGTFSLSTGRVGSSVIPDFDDGYSIGDPSFKFASMYTNLSIVGQLRRQPAIVNADIGTSAAQFRKLWVQTVETSAGLTAFGPIAFGSVMTTDGDIRTQGTTRALGQSTSAGTRWNTFANTLDVLDDVTIRARLLTDGTTRPIGTNVSATSRFDLFANDVDVLGQLLPRAGRTLEHPNTPAQLMALVDNHKVVARGRVLAGVLSPGSAANFNVASIANAGGNAVSIAFDTLVATPYTVLLAGAGAMTARFVRVTGTPVTSGFAVACEDSDGLAVDLNVNGGFYFLVVGRSNAIPS